MSPSPPCYLSWGLSDETVVNVWSMSGVSVKTLFGICMLIISHHWFIQDWKHWWMLLLTWRNLFLRCNFNIYVLWEAYSFWAYWKQYFSVFSAFWYLRFLIEYFFAMEVNCESLFDELPLLQMCHKFNPTKWWFLTIIRNYRKWMYSL